MSLSSDALLHSHVDHNHETKSNEGHLVNRLRECIINQLTQQANDSICPTEIARIVASDLNCEWQDLMRPVRYVSGLLAEAGFIEILQYGVCIHISEARGPIRLRLKAVRFR
jgi:hypothetical protein